MFEALIVVHILVSFSLVLVVLMQSSKGEGLAGSAFGGGGGGLSGAVFGGRGAASFLSRATTVLAVLFMVSCLILAYLSAGTRIGTTSTSTGDATSPITERAQQEQQRAIQQQQSVAADSVAGGGALDLQNLIGDTTKQTNDTTPN